MKSFRINIVDGITVVSPQCEAIDADNVGAFKQVLHDALENSQQLVVDLGGLQFLDSSAVGALLAVKRRASAKDAILAVSGVTGATRTLFGLLRLHRVLDLFESRQDALDHLRASWSRTCLAVEP